MGSTARIIRLISAVVLTLALAVPAHGAESAAFYASARQAFQEAYARVPDNLPDAAASDSARLKSYPLYPYLEAARIEQALLANPDSLAPADQRAAAFLTAYGGMPVSRDLRQAWLESLARRSQWNLYLQAYLDTAADDAARCESLVARVELGKTDGLVRDIEKAWLTPHSLPECAPAFDWLKQNGVLTTALIEQRARLALESSDTAFARQIIDQLPSDRAGPLLQWAALLERPQRGIDALIASPDEPVEAAALLAGWTRLARQDSSAAEQRYARFVAARRLSGEAASPYALALALSLAWDRNPAALEYFERVAPRDLDDSSLQWRARAALWSKDWPLVLTSIAGLTQTEQQTARWRYWAARAAQALHHPAQAEQLFESLLPDDDYYSALAAARLSRPVTPHPQALAAEPAMLAAIERQPPFERARELYLCGMQREAAAEWHFGYASLSPDERLQAIHLAADWGWFDQAVETATAQHVFNDYALLYPRPFDAAVNAAARLAQLAPAMVYGVIRQESLYRIDAVSAAGALGLMQLMPETARRTARHWKLSRPASADLLDPAVNISLGAARLRMLLDRLDEQVPVALASYNAGLNAVTHWLPPEPLDADIWIENIPYNETREYVERVLWHSLLFRWLRSAGAAQRADTWLSEVRPLTGPQQASRMAAAK
jgi:soluble lytic murein transglycosylase